MQKCSFFPGGLLSKQSFNLFFQTIELAKQAFATRLVQENLHFCMHYFSKMKTKAPEKMTGRCFVIESKVTIKNLAHLEAKKRPA